MNTSQIVELYCKQVSSTPGYLCNWSVEDATSCFAQSELKSDDIAIYYDWESDEMDEDQFEVHNAQCEEGWDNIYKFMRTLGYEFVMDNDGSGNGLHYGGHLFRKGYTATKD